jgi:hypothetical protein
MLRNERTRTGLAPRRALNGVCCLGTADAAEDNSESLIRKQADWITRRLGLPPERAQLVAALAFECGKRA